VNFSTIIYLAALLLLAAAPRPQAADWEPLERLDQVWRVSRFTDDAGAAQLNVFNIAFQRDAAAPAGWVAWLATSDGLLEYDGHHWRRHTTANGLPSQFVRAVCVTRDNQLWVGTDQGAGVYNKLSFNTMGSDSGLAGRNVRRVVEDAGGTLWFCSDSWPDAGDSGGITSLREGHWRAYTTADGLPSNYVVHCLRDSSGRMWAATSLGVAELVGGQWKAAPLPPLTPPGNWTSATLVETRTGEILVSTGLELFVRAAEGWVKQPPQIDTSYGMAMAADGALLACARLEPSRRAFARWSGSEWKRLSAGFSVPSGHVEDLAEAPDGSIWAVGHGLVTRWQRRSGEWTEFAGVGLPTLVDSGGGAWFLNPSAAADEPSHLARRHAGKWMMAEGPWLGLEQAPGGVVWGVKSKSLARWRSGEDEPQEFVPPGLERLVAARVDGRGRLWALGLNQAGGIQAAWLEEGVWTPLPIPGVEGALHERLAAAAAAGIWFVAAREDHTNATLVLATPASVEPRPVLGEALGRFRSRLAPEPGSAALWLFGDNGLRRFEPASGGWSQAEVPLGRQILGLQWRSDGLWAAHGTASGGQAGLSRRGPEEWGAFPFPKLNGLQQSPDGTLLAGSRGGFLILHPGDGQPPLEVDLPRVNVDVRGVIRDGEGAFWAGDGQSVFRFRPDSQPPETRLSGGAARLTSGVSLEVRASASTLFQPGDARAGITFQWRLDGREWSPPDRSATASFPTSELKPGPHRVEVRARDSGGESDPTPALFEFAVDPVPLQLRGWFLPAAVSVFLCLAGFAGLAVHSRRKLTRLAANLERQVAERTAELKSDNDRRREVEAALQTSEERLQLALSQTGVGVWEWNPAEGRLYWSEQCGRIYGVGARVQSREEFKRFVHPDDLEWVRRRFDEASETGGLYETEFRIIRADGRERWVANLGKGTYDADGRLTRFVGTVRDTTGEREARALLEEQRHELQLLLDSVPAMIYHKDIHGRLMRVNAAMVRITGLSERSLLSCTDEDLGSPYAGDLRRRDQQVTESGEPLLGVMEQFQTIRGVRWLLTDRFPLRDKSGRITGLIGFSLDITERKQAEEALRGSEERLREVVDSIHEVFWTWDVRSGRFVYANPAYEKLWGRSIEGLLSNPAQWLESIHPEDREQFLQAAMPGGVRGEYDLQYRVLRPSGEVRWMHDRAFAVRGPDGAVERITGIAEDITARKASADELRQAQKMAAIGQLSGGVAHDFNNLLTVILMHVSNLEDNPDLPEAVLDSLAEVRSASDRAAALTRQLLMFSRRQTIQVRALDLNDTVRGMAKLLRRLIGEQIAVEIDFSPEPLPIRADAGMVDQALMNLAVNARDAMPSGGRLSIRTSRETITADAAARHPGASPGQFACITVADNGCGIPPEVLPRIFEPFFTTKETGKGTGLGLATVFGILEQHRGWIMVESTLGVGTTFRAHIPLAPPQAARESKPAPGAEKLPKGAETIFVVEDEEQLRTLIRLILSRLGYQIIEAGSGPEALDIWGKRRDEVKLLITDLVMPGGMSGFDLAAILLRDRPDLKVLYSSGYSPDLAGREVKLQDGVNFLAKPYQAAELARMVRGLLESPARPQT